MAGATITRSRLDPPPLSAPALRQIGSGSGDRDDKLGTRVEGFIVEECDVRTLDLNLNEAKTELFCWSTPIGEQSLVDLCENLHDDPMMVVSIQR